MRGRQTVRIPTIHFGLGGNKDFGEDKVEWN